MCKPHESQRLHPIVQTQCTVSSSQRNTGRLWALLFFSNDYVSSRLKKKITIICLYLSQPFQTGEWHIWDRNIIPANFHVSALYHWDVNGTERRLKKKSQLMIFSSNISLSSPLLCQMKTFRKNVLPESKCTVYTGGTWNGIHRQLIKNKRASVAATALRDQMNNGKYKMQKHFSFSKFCGPFSWENIFLLNFVPDSITC